jgi:4-amino-4-deoxychorismate lyase
VTLLAVAVSGRGLVSVDEPVLHADDEALLRGRAVFETLRIYDGRPFRLQQHLDRLAASARRIDLAPVDPQLLAELVEQALAEAGESEAVLRLLWTPGREGVGTPLGLVLVSTLPPGSDEERERGLKLITAPAAVSPFLAGVKSTSYAANMAARNEALRRDADDAVFVTQDRVVLEGPTANVWWREGRRLLTPSLELPILGGVTRSVLLETAPDHGYELEEGAFPLDRMLGADEVFVTSTIREVAAVIAVDGRPVGGGRPGEAARALQAALRARVALELAR